MKRAFSFRPTPRQYSASARSHNKLGTQTWPDTGTINLVVFPSNLVRVPTPGLFEAGLYNYRIISPHAPTRKSHMIRVTRTYRVIPLRSTSLVTLGSPKMGVTLNNCIFQSI